MTAALRWALSKRLPSNPSTSRSWTRRYVTTHLYRCISADYCISLVPPPEEIPTSRPGTVDAHQLSPVERA